MSEYPASINGVRVLAGGKIEPTSVRPFILGWKYEDNLVSPGSNATSLLLAQARGDDRDRSRILKELSSWSRRHGERQESYFRGEDRARPHSLLRCPLVPQQRCELQ